MTGLLESYFSTQCNLILPLSIDSILVFPYGRPVAAYIFFLVFTSFLSFRIYFLQYRILEGSSYAVREQSSESSLFYCMQNIPLLLDPM